MGHLPNDNLSDNTNVGMVFRKSKGTYFVRTAGQEIVCALSNQLHKQLIYPIAAPTSIRAHVVAVKDIGEVDPVAIGDRVRFVEAGEHAGMIIQVLPRKNKLGRLDPGFKPLEQVIVANVDQVVLVVAAAQPEPRWHLVDRYLAQAEIEELPALICLTKLDLVDYRTLADEIKLYQEIGYPVMLTSAYTGAGIEELKAQLRDRVSVLAGQSGVGKTSLLNRIQSGLGLRVAEISRTSGKGKHTTSQLEMFALDMGGSIVDTPGIKYFKLWDAEKIDLASLFREMRPYLGTCQFRADCTHVHEPGCAIRQAVAREQINERRYQSYLRLMK